METVNKDILKYFSNPSYQTIKSSDIAEINQDDKKFYRKRVLAMGKDIYAGNHYNDILNESFDNFIYLAINHCQMIDKRDLLQEDYPNVDVKKGNTETLNDFDMDNTNNDVMRHNKPRGKTLDGFVTITSTTTENKFIPIHRKVNLKQDKLKTKGIKSKGIKSKGIKTNEKDKNV
jgi:hypothetical protein|tara:strand:+ start:3935 stop:4459 length:525 start_codon:yes stop_codon:yes gene_type:complete